MSFSTSWHHFTIGIKCLNCNVFEEVNTLRIRHFFYIFDEYFWKRSLNWREYFRYRLVLTNFSWKRFPQSCLLMFLSLTDWVPKSERERRHGARPEKTQIAEKLCSSSRAQARAPKRQHLSPLVGSGRSAPFGDDGRQHQDGELGDGWS